LDKLKSLIVGSSEFFKTASAAPKKIQFAQEEAKSDPKTIISTTTKSFGTLIIVSQIKLDIFDHLQFFM